MQNNLVRKGKLYRIVVQFICALLIILWLYTGMNKALDYEKFKYELGRSPFLHDISGVLSVAVPFGEMLIAIALITPRFRLLGLYASFFLMALFTGYIYIMLYHSFDLPCSCGGVLASMSWENHLIFNGIFTFMSGTGVLLASWIHRNADFESRSILSS